MNRSSLKKNLQGQMKNVESGMEVDSIAVSLSTNSISISIRRQDPNIYSDTETRALSRGLISPAKSQKKGTGLKSVKDLSYHYD